MTTGEGRLGIRHGEVATKVMEGETVVIALSTGLQYSVGEVGGRVWSLIEQNCTANEIAAIVAAEYGVPTDKASADVAAFVKQLADAKLIEVDVAVAPTTAKNQPNAAAACRNTPAVVGGEYGSTAVPARADAAPSGIVMSQLDPAAALVTICGRCTFGDLQRAEIREILQNGVDWSRVLALAEKNYVLPLLFESLTGDLTELVDEAAYARLKAQRQFLRLRAALFCDELIRLSGLLESAGIAVLHYKGPVTSERLYGDRYRRTYLDLDFLVRREDLDAVSRLLREQGYHSNLDFAPDEQAQFEREQKEYAFVSGLVCVEPHWSVTARRYPFPIGYPGLWRRAVVHEFGGAKLRTFSPADTLMILSMVGAKGHWKRLQMVVDVAQCYRSLDPVLAQPVLDDAREIGCERVLLVGAHLAETLLGAPIPGPIRARLAENRNTVEKISRRVTRDLFSSSAPSSLLGTSAHLFSPLLYRMRERRRDRLTYLVRTTTTPTPVHLRRFRLPKWAHPAYRLIVPVHDYLLVPAVHATRAYFAKVRGRRATQSGASDSASTDAMSSIRRT